MCGRLHGACFFEARRRLRQPKKLRLHDADAAHERACLRMSLAQMLLKGRPGPCVQIERLLELALRPRNLGNLQQQVRYFGMPGAEHALLDFENAIEVRHGCIELATASQRDVGAVWWRAGRRR